MFSPSINGAVSYGENRDKCGIHDEREDSVKEVTNFNITTVEIKRRRSKKYMPAPEDTPSIYQARFVVMNHLEEFYLLEYNAV
jgi:hypothetical protein